MASKLVHLTWRDGTQVKTEYCELVGDDAIFYTRDGRKLDLPLADILAKQNYVMFEDYEGVFGLKPSQIISIQIVREY